MKSRLLVVGSLSIDLVLEVPRLPAKGETIIGSSFETFCGGKGNNQTVAAARAGADVMLLGKTGQDEYGQRLRDTLIGEGVDITHLMADSTQKTGIANIWVGPTGENSIVIVPNSNHALRPQDITDRAEIFTSAAVVLMQLESPFDTVAQAAQLGRQHGAKVVLNPAPAPIDGKLPEQILRNLDFIVPNETECELLTGIAPNDETQCHKALDALLALGVETAIITLGERGAVYKTRGMSAPIYKAAHKVEVKDTTAAGDAFCGALCGAMAAGKSLDIALDYALAAGSLACTKSGAVPSLPDKAAIEKLMTHAKI